MVIRLALLLCILLLLSSISVVAQPWSTKAGGAPERNFYTIQKEFYKAHDGKIPERGGVAEEQEKENEGMMLFKRWEWFWEPRVYPSGELPPPDILATRLAESNTQQRSPMRLSSRWMNVGPSVVPAGEGGAGRVNCIVVHPADSMVLFAGSASGGLWKSTDGGLSWTTNTDQLGSIGVSSIVFNPADPNIMYIATGDCDAGDTYSIGVLKSTDGGSTWNSTGLNYSTSSTVTIRTLVHHPTNTNILMATTSNGIYRTTNAGVNWSPVASGSYRDLNVNRTDPTIWYATRDGVGVYKSTTTGATFTQLIGVGLPSTNFARVALAIAASNPSYVYALYVNTASGFYGLYRTTTAGTSWALQSNTPNILSWDGTGSDGQGWYDLVLDVDPTNPAVVYAGGINMYKSTTGGTSWKKLTHWYSGAGYPYIHADQHGMNFHPSNNNTLFVGNDGGVFKSTNGGSAWTDLSGGMGITQFYRLGTSATNVNRIIAGSQDNGTSMVVGGTWARVIGGDGMEALIDYKNDNICYGELYYGDVYRSTNGGSSFMSITGSLAESGGWVTPYIINPINPATLYLGTTKVYRTRNRGTTWTAISGVLTGNTLVSLAVAKSDTNWIYAADYYSLYRTTNGGGAWTDITSGLPSPAKTYIAVHPENKQLVYVTVSGYGSQKVYKTTNGGSSWTNVSTGLPSIPVNCVAIHPSATDNIYVGTDVGVYASTDAGTSWQSFSPGLPNVVVTELEIHETSNKLRAATYGRGIWEIEMGPGTGRIAGTVFFDANNNGILDAGETGLAGWTIHLGGDSVSSQLTDADGYYSFNSLNDGSYTVTVDQQGGWTLQTPAGGSYTVVLTNGSNATNRNFVNYIPGIYENFEGTTFPPTGWAALIPEGDSGWQKSMLPRSGQSAAVSPFFASLTPGRAFLITKRVALGTGVKELRFWARCDDPLLRQPDTLKVLLSTGDALPASFTTTLLACYPGDTASGDPNILSSDYKEYVVSLNDFSGPVYLAFVHEQTDGHTLYLDDVLINLGSVRPVFSSNPPSLSFGYVGVGVIRRDSIMVTNIGATTMNIPVVSSTSNQFFVTPVTATIASFESRTFYISFYPTSGGTKAGYIVFNNNTATTPDSVEVGGIGAISEFHVNPTSLAFGTVKVGQQVQDTLLLVNTGTASLTISSIVSSDPHFSVSPMSGMIGMEDSIEAIVTYTPTAEETNSGDLSIIHSAIGSPTAVKVTGSGASPRFLPSVSILRMNKTLAGESLSGTFSVSNPGTVDLEIGSVVSDNSLFTISPPSASIAPESTRLFTVTFSPTDIGVYQSALIFMHDGVSSPDTVTVNANGADTVKFRTFPVDTSLAAKSVRVKVLRGKPAVKPNVGVWRDSVIYRFDRRKGIMLGLPQVGRAAMQYGWIRFGRGSDAGKFFRTIQTNTAYNAPFDTVRKEGSLKKKKFVRELRPNSEAYTNPLAQALAAFKLNLYSSKLGITPKGLDSLVYVSTGSPWYGMTLSQIANRVDSVLTMYRTRPLPGGIFASVGSAELEELRSMLNDINGAFYAPIDLANGDSVVTGQGLRLAGMVGLQTVPFLDKPQASVIAPLIDFKEDASSVPLAFALYQNYPNPFNPSTVISFTVGQPSSVSLKVYDVLGREVIALVEETLDEGEYTITWDGSTQPSGVYFYRLTAVPTENSSEKFVSVKKLLLIK